MKSEIMYPFGYLLTKKQFNNNYNWNNISLNEEWSLYYSTDNKSYELTIIDTKIILLGYFFDIRDGQLDESKILENLITARVKSDNDFLDNLSFLSGRYLLILSYNGKINLYNDIAGLRMVCYHTKEMIIGSHDTLINEVLDNQLIQTYNKPEEISFSNKTRFENVEKLIPNMSLEINSGVLNRYYPLHEYPMKSKEEIKSELITYLNETVKWVKRSAFKPLLSLTGGGDSRMSLAILKPIVQELETFTYLKDTSKASDYAQKTFANDEKIVHSIINNLNIEHNFFTISTDELADIELKNTIKHNVLSNHGLNLANDYYKIYGGKNYMHIRSTALFNVGKYIFPASSLNINEWNIKEISKYVQKWTHIDDEAKNIEYVSNLIDFAQLNDFYNYNPLEMLFLSYRLIQWHSGVVGESDIAFDTMLLLNSRKIVDLMLSYPIEERYKNQLFLEIIEELWPILLYWDVNSVQTLKDKHDTLSKEVGELETINNHLLTNNIYTTSTQQKELHYSIFKNGILFKLGEQKILENTSYEIGMDLAKLNLQDNISVTIEFFYKNEKGRNKIFVESSFFNGKKDILDLYGKHEIILGDFKTKTIKIKVMHAVPTENDSWVNASRVWIGNLKLISKQ